MVSPDLATNSGRCPIAVYARIDLHSTNSYLAVVDEEGEKAVKRMLPNDGPVILAKLETYRKDLFGVVI